MSAAFFLVLTGTTATAQPATVSRGRVVAEDSAGLPGATILLLPDRTPVAVTDAGGAFAVRGLRWPARLEVRYLGYQPRVVIVRSADPVVVVLEPDGRSLANVDVQARRTRSSDDVQGESIALSAADLRQIPAVLGEPDVFKALQLLPGVRGGVDGQAALRVRGGGADENLVLLDDLALYGTTHLFGFLSSFPSGIVSSVEIQKGGFSPRYAGRLSSVVNVQTRAVTESRRARLAISPLAADVTAEGRVPGGTLLVAGRRTFVDLFTRLAGATFHPRFHDAYARYDAPLSSGLDLSVSAYDSRDLYEADRSTGIAEPGTVLLSETADVAWTTQALGARLRLDRPGLQASAGVGHVSYAQTLRSETETQANRQTEQQAADAFRAAIGGLQAWTRAEAAVGRSLTLSGGGMLTDHRFGSLDTANAAPTLDGGVFLDADARRGPVRLAVGAHASVAAADGTRWLNLQPRVRGRLLVTPTTAVRASYVRTAQAVHGVLNVLEGLPIETWVPPSQALPPARADQWAIEVARQPPGAPLRWSLGSYVKRSRGVLTRAEGVAQVSPTEALATQVEVGRATAYGVEGLIEAQRGRWSGWIGYTLSRTTLAFPGLDDGRAFPSRYDRRHDLNLVTQYRYGPRTTFSATWLFGTGDAVTVPRGLVATCGLGACLTDLQGLGDALGDRNGARLPAYHRLDLGYRFEAATSAIAFGAFNAYGRANPIRVKTSAGFIPLDPQNPYGLVIPNSRLDGSSPFTFLPYVRYEVHL